MDSLTQLVLGSAVAYSVAGKQLGRKALLIGAVLATLPDLDTLPLSFFNDDFLMLKHHRGLTHSLLFCFGFPFFLAYCSRLLSTLLSFKKFYWMYVWVLLTHTLLDCLTTYGTQLFWPFSPRIAINSIFIVDPAYTIWLLIAVVVCCFKPFSRRLFYVMTTGLLISSIYLIIGLAIKWNMNYVFDSYFTHHQISYSKMMTRPTPFNLVLWSATVKTEQGYYVALRSLFDKSQDETPLFIAHSFVDESEFMDKRSRFVRFLTNGFYVPTMSDNGLHIHDLRFGSMASFGEEAPLYLFTHQLSRPDPAKPIRVVTENPRVDGVGALFKQLFVRLKGV